MHWLIRANGTADLWPQPTLSGDNVLIRAGCGPTDEERKREVLKWTQQGYIRKHFLSERVEDHQDSPATLPCGVGQSLFNICAWRCTCYSTILMTLQLQQNAQFWAWASSINTGRKKCYWAVAAFCERACCSRSFGFILGHTETFPMQNCQIDLNGNISVSVPETGRKESKGLRYDSELDNHTWSHS